MNSQDLKTYVRQLTGLYAGDIVNDNMIYRWLDEAYHEVVREREWDWLETTYRSALPAWTDANEDLYFGYHQFQLPDGTRRILSAYIVSPAGATTEMVQIPEIDHVIENDPVTQYDVTSDGWVRVVPKHDPGYSVKIRYTSTGGSLIPYQEYDEEIEEFVTVYPEPEFDAQFHAIVAYRAAIKVLQFMADDTQRSQYFMTEYDTLLYGLIKFYELDTDYNTFSLGQDGVESRRYVPWFRPS